MQKKDQEYMQGLHAALYLTLLPDPLVTVVCSYLGLRSETLKMLECHEITLDNFRCAIIQFDGYDSQPLYEIMIKEALGPSQRSWMVIAKSTATVDTVWGWLMGDGTLAAEELAIHRRRAYTEPKWRCPQLTAFVPRGCEALRDSLLGMIK
jgi:hypothetical protein